MKSKKRFTISSILIVFFVVMCFCIFLAGKLSPPKPQITKTPFKETSTPAHTPIKTIGALPGLQPADVTVNLEQRGFNCGTVEKGDLYYIRTCDKKSSTYSAHVEIYGRELFTVDFIDSTVLQSSNPDDSIAAAFLGFMATMPYKNSLPADARSWVETEITTLKGNGDRKETIFSGVSYSLFGDPPARSLEMGTLP